MIPAWVRTLTIVHAVGIAVVAVVIARYVFTRGLLNALAWLVALGALGIGALNKWGS